jgi:hypothetical protein
LWNYQFEPEEIAMLNGWLCTARADGKPRVLILRPTQPYNLSSTVLNFIHGSIKLVIVLESKNFNPNLNIFLP